MSDRRIDAIRTDPVVGRGSCSSVDECWTDEELLVELREYACWSERSAVEHARTIEKRHLERGLNQRWGESSDPQLLFWNEFNAKVKEHPTDELPDDDVRDLVQVKR